MTPFSPWFFHFGLGLYFGFGLWTDGLVVLRRVARRSRGVHLGPFGVGCRFYLVLAMDAVVKTECSALTSQLEILGDIRQIRFRGIAWYPW